MDRRKKQKNKTKNKNKTKTNKKGKKLFLLSKGETHFSPPRIGEKETTTTIKSN
jgi:hypothetical protein